MFYSSWFSFPGCQICLAHYAKGVLQLLILTHRVMLLVRQPPNNSNLVVFSMSRVTVVKGFFLFYFFYTTTIFKSEWKCSEPTPNNILYVAKHTCLPLEIKTLSCISAFTCIYFYFQTQKPCPSFIYSLLTELAFSGHSRNLCFLHFCILLCFSNAFFSLFLFFSLLLFYLGKKRSCPSRYIHYMPCWFSQATMQNYAPY